jgi:hypothetical protein
MTDLTFDPLIPGALWLVLALAGGALLAWYALRRPPAVSSRRWTAIVALMSVALLLVLGLLLNPTWSHELPPPAGKPVLTVLVDSSGSMATPDATGGVTRFSAAGNVATDFANNLASKFDIHIRTFDQSERTIDAASLSSSTPTGASTDLSTALTAALTDEHPQGQAIVLLSDGIDNAGGGSGTVLAAVRTAKAMAAPIYTRTFGGDVKSIDLAVEIRSPQEMAVVAQKVPLVARVTHAGIPSGKAVVSLWQGTKQIGSRDAMLDPGGATDVTFLLSQEKVGVYPYEVRVEPLPGETSQANNSASFMLRVVDEPIRVLVLEGKPYWDSKFFTRTLMSDPAVALDCVVRLSDSRLLHRTLSHHRGDETRATTRSSEQLETWKIDSQASEVLSSPDKLRSYQVIVIGRDAEPFLDDVAVANLQSWVAQQGGSLLCYRGSPTSATNQRLAKLLPVRWAPASESRFRVALTDQGRDLNWFNFATNSNGDALPRLPSLAAAAVVDAAKPLAVVLAQGVGAGTSGSSPAVVYQPYGSGRVVVVEGAGMWRWAFLAPQFQDQEQVYATLWHSMMRWLTSGQGLSPGQTVSLRADKVRFGADEPATATLLAREDVARDKMPLVQLAADGSSETKTFAPAPLGNEAGVFRVNFGQLAEGRYQAKLSNAKADDPSSQIVFDVRKFDQELLDLQSRPDLMARIASDSGGAVLNASSDASSEVGKQFAQHLARVMPPHVERTTAWDRWWILVAVLALWTTAWAVRRAGGLV